jgi:2-keto-4-pentenoate hydratase/2-oxohepta-3-ene-1,7-dioic acid hydratase in catechol pathway
MIIKRILGGDASSKGFAVWVDGVWKRLEIGGDDLVEVLSALKGKGSDEVSTSNLTPANQNDVIPYRPASYRDFMLYEQHAIDAGRGFIKKYMPKALPVMKIYELFTGKIFPPIRPSARYYKYPIYYLGNHLNFFSEGDVIQIPSYTQELDYELEIAAIIIRPLKNAQPEEVDAAIGGFVILNDFSARDQQMDEMKSGFGPMKTKNFANAISATVATADAILPVLNALTVKVSINNKLVAQSTTGGYKYSIQEAIAYASWEEQLHPGELFAMGTIPGCAGIENGNLLNKGDTIKLEVEGIGSLTNRVG